MNKSLIKTLCDFRNDVTLVIGLYQQLFNSRFCVLAKKPAEDLQTMLFLTYPTKDGIRELPVFTEPHRDLLLNLSTELLDAITIEIDGKDLWPKMLDIVKTDECEVAIDPGEHYGIRLTQEMILGMVCQYGTTHT